MAKGETFERHRQPWTADEIQKLHTLAKKGMALKAIAKALKRSEESTCLLYTSPSPRDS